MSQIKDNTHIEVQHVKEEHEMLKKKQAYLPLRILVIPGIETTVSKEVREYVNLPSSREIVHCQAILVDNLAHKIIANFMMKLYPQKNHFKVFSKRQDAINWLRAQLPNKTS